MLIKRAVFFEVFFELRIPIFLHGDLLFFGLGGIVDLACVVGDQSVLISD